MSDRCAFDLCDGDGLLYDAETNTAYPCQCRQQLIARRRASSLSAVIPRRYRDVSFDRPPATDIEPATVAATRRFAATIEDELDAGRVLWFMGPPGTGKTTLAMLVSKAVLEAGRTAAIYSLPRLLNEIRHTYDTGGHNQLLDRLAPAGPVAIHHVGG